jgi:hypothetical protein
VFKITQPNDYTWPVTVNFPTDGGRTEKATFDAKFKRMTQTRLAELRDAIEKSATSDVEIAREVLVGWSGVTDDKGDVPYSEAARDQMLEIPLVAASIVMAMFESLAGAKRKN